MEEVNKLEGREGEIFDNVHYLVWMIDLVESQRERESSQRGNNHNTSLMGFQKQFYSISISLYTLQQNNTAYHG